jgi:hypothetical protein
MPRKRSIDPAVWTDEELAVLPVEARHLYLGIKSNADDEGRMRASPVHLKMVVFPNDPYTYEQVKEWRDMLAATQSQKIVIYTNSSSPTEYLFCPDWKRDQYVNRPTASKLPPPPRELIPPHYRGDWPDTNPNGESVSSPTPITDTSVKSTTGVHEGSGAIGVGVGSRTSESVSGMDSLSESESIPDDVDKSKPTYPHDDADSRSPPSTPDTTGENLEPIEDWIRRCCHEIFEEPLPSTKRVEDKLAELRTLSESGCPDEIIEQAIDKIAGRRPRPKYPLGYVLKVATEAFERSRSPPR